MINKRFRQMSCFILIILVAACSSGELTERTAVEQIKREANAITKEIALGDKDGISTLDWPDYMYDIFHTEGELSVIKGPPTYRFDLSEKGLISYKARLKEAFINEEGTRSYRDTFLLELTPEGKKYAIRQRVNNLESGDTLKIVTVKLAELSEFEITGITAPVASEGKKICSVEYNAKFKLTPFGEVYREDVNENPRTARFELYSDGWRIK